MYMVGCMMALIFNPNFYVFSTADYSQVLVTWYTMVCFKPASLQKSLKSSRKKKKKEAIQYC